MSYDSALVPQDVWGAASLASAGSGTRTVLRLSGLVVGRRYSAIAHVRRCGRGVADAGPVFLVRPGSPPAAANEVRLTDRTGPDGDWFEPDQAGEVTIATDDDGLTADRVPGSIVLYAGPVPRTGRLGAVIGCLSLAA